MTPTADDRPDELSTLEPPRPVEAGPRSVVWRRVGTVGLVALVLAGMLNLFGLRNSTTTRSESGYTVSVHYARIARAGLDAPWTVTITNPAGFGKDVQVVVTADYFDIFESQGMSPEPSDETQDGQWSYWTFTSPPGDTLTIDADVYVQPSSHRGASGTVAVLVDGRRVASTPFRTTLLP
jgi:hypothetical protein